jgi:PKD repeat protein
MVFVGSSDEKVYAFGIHDIGILSVTPSKTTAIVGDTVTVNVIVKNEGNFTEVFSVAAYYNTTLIANQTVSLADGSSTTVPFLWKTATVALGTYTISAKASVVPGETHTADNSYTDGSVKIIQYPKGKFTFSPTIPLANQTVTFNASASTPDGGTIVAYGWNFGDGNLGAGEVVTHAYASPGNYTVILTVTDSEGLINQATANLKVIWYPTAKFSYSPVVVITTEPVTFNASASTPNSGTIVKYSWDFGDNTTATGKVLTHTYTSVGSFIVVLNVTNSQGLSNTMQTSVTTYARPAPYVYYYPSYPSPGELVTFSASYSSDLNGTIISYTWNFSDGTPVLSGKIVTHCFAAHAVYTVQLTLTNNYNINKTISFKIGAGYLVGDTDFNGKIDMADVARFAAAFGARLGQPRYSSACDINNDGRIDMIDEAFIAKEFGKKGP